MARPRWLAARKSSRSLPRIAGTVVMAVCQNPPSLRILCDHAGELDSVRGLDEWRVEVQATRSEPDHADPQWGVGFRRHAD